MEEFITKLKENKLLVGGFLILLLIIMGTNIFIFSYFKYNLSNDIDNDVLVDDYKDENEKVLVKYSVEVKGQVKAPGVYEINSDKRVIDAVTLAGGLTKNADTSVNNLSKKVADEMVIIIYSKDEVKNFTKVKEEEELKYQKCLEEVLNNDNCCLATSFEEKQTTKDSNEPKKISINIASKEELQELPGIGESKALAIIEYRSKNKFKSIEEITKVSGIGESIYVKIKDFITT